MAKTANLYVRIEPDVKEQAETILSALGIPASNAITMFYKQIILRRGLPFDVKMLANILLDASTLSAEQMDAELQKGYDDMQNGRTKSHKKMIAVKKSRLNCKNSQKNSNKTRDAFLENGFGGPEAQYFTGIVIDPVFDLLDRFRCDFPEVCSFWEPTADHFIYIFV